MRRVLAGRVRTVMAIRTIAHDIHVIEIGWNPARSRVAVVAIIATCNMIGVLARCDIAVVTGTAAPQHVQMVDREHRAPGTRAVAVLAGSRGLDVCR